MNVSMLSSWNGQVQPRLSNRYEKNLATFSQNSQPKMLKMQEEMKTLESF